MCSLSSPSLIYLSTISLSSCLLISSSLSTSVNLPPSFLSLSLFPYLIVYYTPLAVCVLPVFYILFQSANPPVENDFSNLGNTMLTMFRLSLGLSDIDTAEIKKTKAAGWLAVYIVIFLVFSYLLLINFLIATMQHTQDRLLQQSYLIWKSLVRQSDSEHVEHMYYMCTVLAYNFWSFECLSLTVYSVKRIGCFYRGWSSSIFVYIRGKELKEE